MKVRPRQVVYHQPPSRSGMAALIAIATVSFVAAAGALLLKAGLAEQQYTSRLRRQHQAEWLVEAGLERAAAQRLRSAKYAGETWTVPAEQIGTNRPGVVHIVLKADAAQPHAKVLEVTVEIPDGVLTLRAAKELSLFAE